MQGFFVAGTDTGIGKTFVASALCRALRSRGSAVVGLKPYETGCAPEAVDAAALEREARSGLPLEQRCPFRYRTPVAPAVAAVAEGRRGRLSLAIGLVERAEATRVVVVEGAGGLCSPLDGAKTNLNLAAALGLPVVLVAKNGLGTLSQLTLAVSALRRRRVRIAAIVLSRALLSADASQATNRRWAMKLTGIRKVIELPRTSVGAAAKVLAAQLLRDD